jgi:hypothetical protein
MTDLSPVSSPVPARLSPKRTPSNVLLLGTSVLGLVDEAFDFDLCLLDLRLRCTGETIGLAFRLELLVARQTSGGFLHSSLDLVGVLDHGALHSSMDLSQMRSRHIIHRKHAPPRANRGEGPLAREFGIARF